MTPLKVFYNSLGTPEMYAMIRSKMAADMTLVTLDTDEDAERRDKVAGCDVAIVAAKPLTGPTIAAGDRLRLIHHQGVGYHDTVDLAAARARGLRLALTPEGTTIGVAEHAVLLALAAARRVTFADAELRRGHWHVNALRPVSLELYGKTVGFVGFGRIGREAARRFAAFGTRTVFHDPGVADDAAHGAERRPLDWIAGNADLISIHVPLTEATRHLVDAAFIARMKPSAILVNTARGGVVDDAALAAALAEKRILAAGLDVFEGEPIGPDHPYCALPNVVLTPHISAGTRDALSHKMAAVFLNLERFRNGEPLANEVDLATA
ncbi:NAD(P)-dependent oxidoreductase [Acuticoccus mangrovi]|uniref:3-phosphoglycerate dehydrogenase n=1 Tax=Acuticoccus mangrovi TaxID=2796142 RepID=A0A934IL01_9HYPH|nr:NAD(P)-dependent oxidoreductase [Acuticoccus mangrovi]MBJ3774217.1 3-phosphoglycerate dehydrogenase [Acuticoccus mangrovi]